MNPAPQTVPDAASKTAPGVEAAPEAITPLQSSPEQPSPEQLRKQFEPREVHVLEVEPQVHAARFSPCGKFLLAGGYDARLRRWAADDPTFPELAPLAGHGGWVQAFVFGADRQTVYSGDSWGMLSARNYADDQAAPRWQHDQAHASWIRQLALSPDGKSLATCGMDQMVRVWDAESG
jgi:WD40 repeat protein